MTSTTDRLIGYNSALAFKAPCRVATTANITLSGYQTVDGVALASTDLANGYNMRVLVKDQTDQTENGIYIFQSGLWERAKDFNGNTDIVKGTRVYVQGGSVGATTYVVTSADPIVIDTSNITFATEQSLIGAAVEFVFDGGGAPIRVGQYVDYEMPFGGDISQHVMLADQSGTIVLDLRRDSYANFPPTSADTIVASAPPTITADSKATDTTLTGWTTTLPRGDIIRAIITSTSGVIQQLTLSLRISRSSA